ncbi:hypothetical protein GCM10010193_62300 [Kitasatospora atroaurantiaca]|uniref:Uncharacterized protein n=1 Tax=Kitasatospora atroaurantiaca TaxID=285545 RepID=A0A561F1V6_9ACTN|nr:hypothetical protein [Kitasatospora atroaurantiaca]TWE21847.1 hypothetical protein FB465_7081 [Kitasatospora atroaurantiaca]
MNVPIEDCKAAPELLAWLDERSAGFARWAEETGTPQRWDFSPESLDALEDLVREVFADEEEVLAAKGSPFVHGATWYIGEVIRRSGERVAWGYDPTPPTRHKPSAFFDPGTRTVIDTPFVGQPGSVDGEWLYPMGALNELYCTMDEWDDPIEWHLRHVLGNDDEDDEDEE